MDATATGLELLHDLAIRALREGPVPPAESLDWNEEYAYTLGVQAYIWGFPWLYLAQLRWLWTTPAGHALAQAQGLSLPYAPINRFFNSPVLASPATQTGGSPNVDTLYSTAWVELSGGPMVLSVPAVPDRYYSMEIACMDADNLAYVGTRSTGTAPGNYLIAGPGWNGDVPPDVLDILPRSRTPSLFVLGRTGINNKSQADLDAAHAVQAGYQLRPLSTYPATPPAHPTHAQVPLGIDNSNPLGKWLTMNRAMSENPPGMPPGISQSQLLALFATIGIGPNQDLERQSPVTRRGLWRAAKKGYELLNAMTEGRGKTVNGWQYPPRDIGEAGQAQDYITRAALQALAGIVANDPVEAVYINTWVDSNGQGLTGAGGSRYVLRFSQNGFPPYDAKMHGFWSLTLYDNTYNLVPDSTHYSVNSYDSEYQARDSDGGMTIIIQREEPTGLQPGQYWLQSPPFDFFMFLRVYIPGPEVSNTQTWVPPAVEKSETDQ
jgi:hypothetical protein